MRVHKDLVLKARMRLMSHDGRVLRGEEGLRVYRTLFPLAPRVYGSRLAYVLIEVSRRPAFAALPERRRALLTEAVAAARALDEEQPYRAKMLERALGDLALLDSTAATPAVQPGQEGGAGQ
ncbi:hypothetical protein [Kitasatospora sp. NPDC101183]|uniref:hypothetical protein n=1 Tax=Kitasatospora sp. NPDC101183 TaxID=3364100 RepID=UPI00382BC3F2